MSGKLDQSLDTIMAEGGKSTAGRRRRGPLRRASNKAKTTAAAPTGGIQKNIKAPKNAPTAPAVAPPGDSKIIVGNLPMDIDETQLKDFFQKAIGNVKKVLLSYGPNGRSRGEATVIFNKLTKAAEAMSKYNGVKVDDKPLRIEIVGSAALVEPAKTLSDRMAKPKSAVKENAKAVAKKVGPKPATNGAAKPAKADKKKAGRAGRPKAKTADELDAEMQDYFKVEAPAAATNGEAAAAPAAATNGGSMETDEVL